MTPTNLKVLEVGIHLSKEQMVELRHVSPVRVVLVEHELEGGHLSLGVSQLSSLTTSQTVPAFRKPTELAKRSSVS